MTNDSQWQGTATDTESEETPGPQPTVEEAPQTQPTVEDLNEITELILIDVALELVMAD